MKLTCLVIILLLVHTVRAQFTKAEIAINGLTCSLCSVGIERSLNTLSFVSNVEMDLNKNIAVIYFKPKTPVLPDAITARILDAGFSIESYKLQYLFNGLDSNNDSTFVVDGSKYVLLNGRRQNMHGLTFLNLMSKETLNRKSYLKLQKQIPAHIAQPGSNQKVYLVSL